MSSDSLYPGTWLKHSFQELKKARMIPGKIVLTDSRVCEQWANAGDRFAFMRRTFTAVLVLQSGQVIENPQYLYNCECGAGMPSTIHHFNRPDETEPEPGGNWRSGEVDVVCRFLPERQDDEPDVTNTIIVGFFDGLPRQCLWMKCGGGDCRHNSSFCVIAPDEILPMQAMDSGAGPFSWEIWPQSLLTGSADFFFGAYGIRQTQTEGPFVEITPWVARLDWAATAGNVEVTDRFGRTAQGKLFVRCPDDIRSDPYSVSVPCGESIKVKAGVLTAMAGSELRPFYLWRLTGESPGHFETLGWTGREQSGNGVLYNAPPCSASCSDEPVCEGTIEQVCLAEQDIGAQAEIVHEIDLEITGGLCDPEGPSIVYTTSHMECEESQAFHVSDGLKWNWKITEVATDTVTYHNNDNSYTYTAPTCDDADCYEAAGNACDGRILIEIYCTDESQAEDSVMLTINCVTANKYAYTKIGPNVGCYPGWGVPGSCADHYDLDCCVQECGDQIRTRQFYRWTNLNCAGGVISIDPGVSCPYHYCDGPGDCEPSTACKDIGSYAWCWGPGDIRDKRMDCAVLAEECECCFCNPGGDPDYYASIAEGCCPEELL